MLSVASTNLCRDSLGGDGGGVVLCLAPVPEPSSSQTVLAVDPCSGDLKLFVPISSSRFLLSIGLFLLAGSLPLMKGIFPFLSLLL